MQLAYCFALAAIVLITAILGSIPAIAQSDIMWATHGLSGLSLGSTPIIPLTMSPDGRTAFAKLRMAIVSWNTADGRLLHSIGELDDLKMYSGVATSPDGRYHVATRGLFGYLLLIDAVSGEVVDSTEDVVVPASTVQFSPDGLQLLVIASDNVSLYTLPGLQRVWKVRSVRATAASFSHGGEYVAWRHDERLAIFTRATGSLVRYVAGDRLIEQSGFGEGDQTIVGYNGREIVYWSTADGSEQHAFTDRDAGEGHLLLFDRTGRYAVTTGFWPEGDSTVRVWDTRAPGRIRDYGLAALSYPLLGATISADGREIVLLDGIGRLTSVGLLDGTIGRSVIDGLGYGDGLARFSNDGSRVLVLGADNTVRTFDGASGALLTIVRPNGTARGIKEDASGWIEAIEEGVSTNLRVRAPDGTFLRELCTLSGDIRMLAVSPDEQIIARATADNAIELLRTSDGSVISTLTQLIYPVTELKFSPDGTRIAAGSASGIHVWNVQSGVLIGRTEMQGEMFEFSKDGTMIAGAITYMGYGIGIYTIGGSVTPRFINLGRITRALTFSNDGKWIIASQPAANAINVESATVEHTFVDPSDFLASNTHVPAFDASGKSFVTISSDGDIIRWRFDLATSSIDGDGFASDISTELAGDMLRVHHGRESSPDVVVELYDANGGRVAADLAAGARTSALDVSALASGLYLVRIRSDDAVVTGRL